LESPCAFATFIKGSGLNDLMKKPYILAESHWGTVKELDYRLAVLPWGATEAHNYHLPYGTDNFETEALVYEAARMAWEAGARVAVLPTLPIGVNTGQDGVAMTLNLNPRTQHAILEDVAESLVRHGVLRLLVVNGHGGNDFRQMLREVGRRFPEMFLATCNWYQSVDKTEFFENGGDHADEMETSLMLFARPGLVLPLKEAGEGKSRRFSVEELNESWAWTERKWTRTTEDTGIGDPRKATVEKGERYFRAVTAKLAALMEGIAGTEDKDLYT
jgi:creatinine amidohydrolase